MTREHPVLDEALRRNFRFLVLEVIKQLGSAARRLDGGDGVDVERMASRDDYIDHLRTVLENQCFAALRKRRQVEKSTVDFLRSTTTVTSNLERIADHAVSIVRQADRLDPLDFMKGYDFEPFFDVVFQSLQNVVDAYEHRDSEAAVEIADGELELDTLYRDRFARILGDLESGGPARPLVTALLIFHYLERIGDCLQNIGEAIIFAEVGERLKMPAYRELAGSLERSRSEPNLDDVRFEGVWGTRSGAQIGKVRAAELSSNGGEAIFKRGDPRKMREERAAMERWARVAPGLAPRILRYQEAERDSMLVEYLEGQTLLEIVLSADAATVRHTLRRVHDTLLTVWTETRDDTPVQPRFIEQLESRLSDVYRVHPYFRAEPQQIGGVRVETLEELLKTVRHLDDTVVAPFSVLGHGDFNLDNVIFNLEDDTVHFIDLHRSRPMDYAQDVSVFLVSNFRVPEFRPRRRAQLNRVIEATAAFARDFAENQGDRTFEARLALGLVRSFVSSTRFDIRRKFAEEMLRRGLYLLERLRRCEDHTLESFRLPPDLLIYES